MEQASCQAKSPAFHGYSGDSEGQDLPLGKDDLVGAMDMVEGVKAGGVDRAAPIARDGVKTAGAAFFVDDGAASLDQNARLSSAPAIGLDNLLALQAVDEGSERDRSARKRGTALLASLNRLQRTMLAGEDPALALRALGDLAAGESVVDDPGLAAILRAIVQRSRIEIARRAASGQSPIVLVAGT